MLLRKSYFGAPLMVVVIAAFGFTYRAHVEPRIADEKVGADEGSANEPAALTYLSFSREDGYIYLSDLRAKSVRRLVKGDNPSLSPRAASVAFTHVEGDTNSFHSTIKTLDLQAGTINEFSSLSGIKSSKPQWSPEGNLIAFEYKAGFQWRVGVLDVLRDKWKDLVTPPRSESSVFLSSWAQDGKSILCQDLEYLYEVEVSGSVIQKIPIKEILQGSGGVSSLTRFSFSHGKQHLLFDSTVSPEDNRGIYLFDLRSRTNARITAKEIDASEPIWLPSEREILFLLMEKHPSGFSYHISQISVDGTNLKRLVEGVTSLTYSVFK